MTRALGRALDSLPEQYREVILLRDVEGLTAPDVAASLGFGRCSQEALSQSRRALRHPQHAHHDLFRGGKEATRLSGAMSASAIATRLVV
jgi:DNA-directed RNA polymerase specialized sigma24 family protein